MVTTWAGSAMGASGSANGPIASATFNQPHGLAIGADGATLYVADTSNDLVRVIAPNGLVTTLAGGSNNGPFRDGPADQAGFWEPAGLAVDAGGVIYVTDDNDTVRKIAPVR